MKKLFSLLFLAHFVIAADAQVATDKIPGSNCNNIVRNTLPPDALNRSPSDCEVQFDRQVRTAIRDAFSKALQKFHVKDWIISDTAVEVLKEISKHTEQNFFNLSYNFKIDLNPGSEMYMTWGEKNQAMMQELKNPNEATFKKFTDFNYKMNNAIHIRFYIGINTVSERIYFLNSGQQQISIPGAALAVKGPRAAGLSGGGDDNAVDACLIVFGRSKITSQKESGGGTSYTIENIFPKGVSHLTVQQVSIRIECNDELLNTILKDVDFTAIKAMIK